MKLFLKKVKDDRSEEIRTYREKGIDVDAEKYCLTGKLSYVSNGTEESIGVSVSRREVHFIYIEQNANIDFSIGERYRMLETAKRMYPGLTSFLQDQLDHKNEYMAFMYRGEEYRVLKLHEFERENEVIVPIYGTGEGLKLSKLLALILFSQSMSNVYYKKKSKGSEKLLNGTLRLYTALLSTKNEKLLKDKGWSWDFENEVYRLDESERSQRTFSLTEEEYRDIISIGNSRSRQ